ncbi:hypothetical protein [Leptospira bouyouniensis]|uniref:hypothetical protein n=1 Tax=Leptospira bouyouniensis TaxID=2484911 RepID=UPI001090C8C4|nr:hypothetical protein [Leptospira bouyouniensis]TGM87972.1 hypothetical protein EHQ99_00340 [Leptospira bouyouniensis]
MKTIKIFASFLFLINCSTYEITNYYKTVDKDIIWIRLKSQDNSIKYQISDTNNLSLKIAKKLQNFFKDKELKILFNQNEFKSELIIEIDIKYLESSTKISDQMVITAGLNSLLGGPTHIDTIKSDIDVSIIKVNENKKTKSFILDYKKPYNSLFITYPFLDYYFLNIPGFNPMYSNAYENFIVESTLELLKNEI